MSSHAPAPAQDFSDFRERSWAAPAAISDLQMKALVAAGVGTVATAIGFFVNREQFFLSYLIAYVFVLSVALGCLGVMMLHHLSRGAWGLVIRRVLEAAARTIPIFFILFLPLLAGMDVLFPWARPEVVAGDPLLQAKEGYLNTGRFILSLVLYFAIWSFLAWLLSRMSKRQDETGDPYLARRMQVISAPGLGLFCLAVTFASFDWLMSLDPHWYSTIYGVWFLGGQGLAAFAFVIMMALFLARRAPMQGVLAPRHFHDWGKLMLAFVMLWAYFSFSQFLIIWSANLPPETSFYISRTRNGWQWVALALIVGHFILPFVLLLSRDLKRNGRSLTTLAVVVMIMRWVDIYWQAAPLLRPETIIPHWMDLATVLALGGLWLWLFGRELKSRPLLPVNAPNLEEAMGHE